MEVDGLDHAVNEVNAHDRRHRSLILQHLRALRADVADVKERRTQVEADLSTLGQWGGALTAAVYSGKSEADSLRRRVERIEQHLDLADT